MAAPIHELLPDYHEIYYLKVTEPEALATLNQLSLIGLAISVVVMAVWVFGVQLVRGPYPTDFTIPWYFTLILAIGVLPLHEMVHGIAIRWAGHRPRYGAMYVSLGRWLKLPYVLYATTDGAYFRRYEFNVIALAPLVVITAVGLFAIALLPDAFGLPFSIMIIMNASGAVGDLWMTRVTLRYSPNILIRDEADAIRIYAPAPEIPAP